MSTSTCFNIPPYVSPRYLRAAWTRLVRNACTALYRPPSGSSPPPVLVVLNPTSDCNLRCRMCFGRGRNVVRDTWGAPAEAADLSLDDYRALVTALAPRTPSFYITGGEPLMTDKTLHVIRTIKSHGLYVSMNSNGVLLQEHASELVAAGLDRIIVSIDGPPEVHDAIRGQTFDRIREGIAAVQAARQQAGARRPNLRAQCVISSDNAAHLVRTAELAGQLGLSEIRFQHLMFAFDGQPSPPGDEARSLVTQADVSRPVPEGGPLDEVRLRSQVEQLRQHRGPPRIRFEPPIRTGDIEGYYRDPRHPFRNDCLSAWRRLVVSPSGGLGPCQGIVLERYPATSVWDAWNGTRFRRFRSHVRKNGLFPFCSRCCHREYYREGIGVDIT